MELRHAVIQKPGKQLLAAFPDSGSLTKLFNIHAFYPVFHRSFCRSGFKTLSFQPVHRVRTQLMQIVGAGTNPAAMGSAKGDDCLLWEIIAFQKGADNSRCLSMPDRIVKCSPPLQSLVNTGFNAIQKCVLCFFLADFWIAFSPFFLFLFYILPFSFANTYAA